jgi:signal transduction histidine kinase
MSLRTRILALTIGSAVAVLVLLAIPVTVTVHEGVEEEAEQEATTLVLGVADYLSTGAAQSEDLRLVVQRGNGRRDDAAVAVALVDGGVVGSDDFDCTAPSVENDNGRDGGRGDGRGDHLSELLPVSEAAVDEVAGGRLVSVGTDESTGAVAVCAFIDSSDVREAVADDLRSLALAGLGVLALVGLAAFLVGRRLGTHLEAAAATADLLSTGDLHARAPVGGPTEVRRVATALNRLAGRIDELLTQERETVADLSHRLRTPLMAVRLDVEALPSSPARQELDEHLSQLERTLTAVIHAARRPEREGAAPHCDGVAVARDRYEYWRPLLEDQERPTSMVLDADPSHAAVRCTAEDLGAAVDALVENAVAHTREGTAVELVVASNTAGGLTFEVRDQGPGVPDSALERGRSDRGSSGLGLDIARACAESSGGRLELSQDTDWSTVRLVLDPAAAQII